MRAFFLAILLVVSLPVLATRAIADSVPEWVRAASDKPLPEYERGVSFAVLLEERVTTIKESGRAETRWRYVVRVLTREGRASARREIYYDSQVRLDDLHGWHVRSDQKVFELRYDEITESSPFNDLYSDIKSKVMRFSEAEVGSVVAFEWTQKEKPLVNQDLHLFQSRSPVLVSRYKLIIPKGWDVKSTIFNHPPIEPVIEGNAYTWQVERLKPIKDEPCMPDAASLSPALAVSYYPPGGHVARGSMNSWQDVSRWAGELMRREPRRKGAIEAKAAELTRGVESKLEKVRIISRWVQRNVRYASIQLSAIGGFRPNMPDAVLMKGYGDCKDKCTLLQAMLRASGIESHLTLVHSGDPARVRPEFPSPLQFNHAILAISVEADFPATATVAGPERLLFFDPTDDQTPLGDLPFHIQGSYGLMVKSGSGALVKLPDQSEHFNTLRREIEVTTGSGPDISARISEVYTGQMASIARRRMALLNSEELAREVAARVARDVPGAAISGLKVNLDAASHEPLKLEYEVRAGTQDDQMNRLMVIRPLILRAEQPCQFTEAERNSPVRFDLKSVQEDLVRIRLPHGFRIDELPPNVEIKSGFGEFTISYALDPTQVIARRRLAIKERRIPATNYAEVKRLFDAAQSTYQSNIVMVRE
jgi:transglutaminase-like putative cysteine protease